uniref:F-box domain-containing protein n=1 Tax=Rhabditophanes sp. KR3021 TaxID=114890 RepID=A0AC35U100_9BILA
MNLSGAPKDILIEIFMKLDPKFLVRTCNLVCKQWYQILEEDTFWLVRATNENCREILPPQELVKLVRNDYRLAKMFIKRPFNRNLIVETYDEKKSTGWNNVDNSVLNSRYSDYVIIKPPTKIVTDSVSIENFIEYNIVQIPQNHQKGSANKYMIIFFGTQEHAYLRESEICKYVENRAKFEVHRKQKHFDSAINEVCVEAGLIPFEFLGESHSSSPQPENNNSIARDEPSTSYQIEGHISPLAGPSNGDTSFNSAQIYSSANDFIQTTRPRRNSSSITFKDLLIPTYREGGAKSASTKKSFANSFSAYYEKAIKNYESYNGPKSVSSNGSLKRRRMKNESISLGDNFNINDAIDIDNLHPSILEHLDLKTSDLLSEGRKRLNSANSHQYPYQEPCGSGISHVFKEPYRDRMTSISHNSIGNCSMASGLGGGRTRYMSGMSDINFDDQEWNPQQFYAMLDEYGDQSDVDKTGIVSKEDIIEGRSCDECGYSIYVCEGKYRCARESCNIFNGAVLGQDKVAWDKKVKEEADAKALEAARKATNTILPTPRVTRNQGLSRVLTDTAAANALETPKVEPRAIRPKVVNKPPRIDPRDYSLLEEPRVPKIPKEKPEGATGGRSQKRGSYRKTKRPVGRPRKINTESPPLERTLQSSTGRESYEDYERPAKIAKMELPMLPNMSNLTNRGVAEEAQRRLRLMGQMKMRPNEAEDRARDKLKVLNKKAKFTPPAGYGGIRTCFLCRAQVRPQQSTKNKHRWRCIGKNCRKWYGWVTQGDEVPLDFGTRGHWKGLNFTILYICKADPSIQTLKYVSFVDFQAKTGETFKLANGSIARVVRRCFDVADLSEAGVTEKNFDGSIIRPRHMMTGYQLTSRFNKRGLEICRTASTIANSQASRSVVSRQHNSTGNSIFPTTYSSKPIILTSSPHIERTLLEIGHERFVVEDDRASDDEEEIDVETIDDEPSIFTPTSYPIKQEVEEEVSIPLHAPKIEHIIKRLPVPIETTRYETNPMEEPSILFKMLAKNAEELARRSSTEANCSSAVDCCIDMLAASFGPLLKVLSNHSGKKLLSEEAEFALTQTTIRLLTK